MKHILRLLLISVSIMTAVSCRQEMTPSLNETNTIVNDYGGETVPGQLIIKVSDELVANIENNDINSLEEAGATVNIRNMERLFPHAGRFEERTRAAGLHKWYVVSYDESIKTKAATSGLSIPGVEIIEVPAQIERIGSGSISVQDMSLCASSEALFFNDPELKNQWHYFNDGSANSSVSGCDINVVPVWERYTTGSEDVIVAVVDEGVDFSHEDLNANMWQNPDEKGDRRYGFNFISNTTKVVPGDHGTHVAGTISAVNNNGIGVSGIAGGNHAEGIKGVRIMSCQIFQGKESGSGAAAIKWGADHGAVISQNSWGYTDATSTPQSIKDAVDYFIKYAGVDENGQQTGPMIGGLVFFAAGNEDRDYAHPASYENVIAVTSVGADYRRAYYSCYGSWADIAAPGGDAKKGNQVVSTITGNRYGRMQGTSMACPHVSGVAALILSKFGGPGFTAEALKAKLLSKTTDIASFNRNHYMGAGLVNAYMGVAGSGGKAPQKPSSITAESNSNTIHISITVPEDEDDGKPYSMIVYYSKDGEPSHENGMFGMFYVGKAEAGDVIEGDISGLDFNTEYKLAAIASDLAGNRSDLSETIIVTTGDNSNPIIEGPENASISLKPHETVAVEFECIEPDGHFYNIEMECDSQSATLDTLQRNMPIIRIKGFEDESGNYSAKLKVTDIYGAETVRTIDYTILENHKPYTVKNIEDFIFSSKSGGTITLPVGEYFMDDDGEQLDYKIDISNTTVLNVTYAKGSFNITPMNYGYSDITITATDIRGETAQLGFRVLVRDSKEDVDVYPNPTEDYLFIRTSTEASVNYELISSSGQTVLNGASDISPFTPAKLDLTQFAPGIYQVSIDINGKNYTRRIVKL